MSTSVQLSKAGRDWCQPSLKTRVLQEMFRKLPEMVFAEDLVASSKPTPSCSVVQRDADIPLTVREPGL